MALTKRAAEREEDLRKRGVNFKDAAAFITRYDTSSGELEVLSSAIPSHDDDAVEAALIACLRDHPFERADHYFLAFVGKNWSDMEQLSPEYVEYLVQEAKETTNP